MPLGLLFLLALVLIAGSVVQPASSYTGTPMTWQGDVSADWNNAGNWDTNDIPNSNSDADPEVAVFPSGTFNDCSVNTTNVPCAPSTGTGGSLFVRGIDLLSGFNGIVRAQKSMTIGADGLTVAAGTYNGGGVLHTINGPVTVSGGSLLASGNETQIDGNFTHSGGEFSARTGTVVFFGSTLSSTIDVLPYVSASTWRASGTYAVSDRVVPITPNGHYYEVTASDGTAGATEPTWPTTTGGAVTADGVTYTEAGTQTIFNNLTLGSSSTGGGVNTVVDNETFIVSGQINFRDGQLNQSTVSTANGTAHVRGSASNNLVEATFDGGTAQLVFDAFANQTLECPSPCSNTAGLMTKVKVDKPAGNFTVNRTIRTAQNFEVAQLGGSFLQLNTGTLVLAGTLTYTQPTSVSKAFTGTISIGDSGAAGTVTVPDGSTMRAGGTLRLTDGTLNKDGGSGTGAVSLTGSLEQQAGADGGTAPITFNGASVGQSLTGNASGTGDLPPITVAKTGTGTLTLASTVRTSKDITITSLGSDGFSATGSTLKLVGSGPQVVTGTNVGTQNYNIVEIGEAGVAANVTLSDTLTATGDVTLRDGTVNGGTLQSQAGITQNADFDGGSATLLVNGAGDQTFTGNANDSTSLLPNVTIDKPSGNFTLAGSNLRMGASRTWTHTAVGGGGTYTPGSVNFYANGNTFAGSPTFGNVTLQDNSVLSGSGILTTNSTLALGANDLTASSGVVAVASGGTLTRSAGGMVVGKLRKTTSGTSLGFEIGDGTNYLPIDMTLSGATDLVVTASTAFDDDGHDSAGTSNIDPAKDVERKWTLTSEGGSVTSYGATLRWVAGEASDPTNLDETKFIVGKFDSGSWTSPYPTVPTPPTADATEITFTGVTSGFSEFAVGEISAPSVTSVTSTTGNGSKGVGAVVNVRLTFSEPVDVTGSPRIELATGEAGDYATITTTPVTSSTTVDFSYTVEAGDTSADLNYDGTDALELNGGSIVRAGTATAALLTLPTTGVPLDSLADNQAIVLDTAGPVGVTLATPGLNLPDPPGTANSKISPGSTTPISITGGNPTDTSGVEKVDFKACAGSGACTFDTATITIGTDSSGPPFGVATLPDLGADGTYKIVARATDNVGAGTKNTTDSAEITVTYDETDPTVTSDGLLLAEVSGPANARTDLVPTGANTYSLRYSPPTSGTFVFRINVTVTDALAGGGDVAFSTLAGAAGFTGGGTTDTLSPFSSEDITVASTNAAEPGAMTITVRDQAGNDIAITVTFDFDNEAPTLQTAAITGGIAGTGERFYGASPPSVPVTLGNGTDTGGSGLDTASGYVEREEAALAGNACGTFGTATQIALSQFDDGDDDSVVDQTCYRYRYKISDKAGNESAFTAFTDTAKTDTTAPAAPGLSFGTFTNAFETGGTVYVKGVGSSFKVTATASDGGSGIASVKFPEFQGDGATADPSAPYEQTYGFETVSAPTGAQNVFATNNSNVSSPNTAFTVLLDSVNPTGSFTAPAGGAFVEGASVALATDSADAASGVQKVEFRRCAGSGCDPFGGGSTAISTDSDPAGGWTATLDTTAGVADGVHRLGARTFDQVNNTVDAVISVTVDNADPTQVVTLTSIPLVNGVDAAFKSGSTVYYNSDLGGGAQNLKLRSTLTDANPASATFTRTAGSDVSLANSGVARTTPGAGVYDSDNITWTGAGGATITARGADAAGNLTAIETLTFTADAGDPTVAITCDGGACTGAYTTTPVIRIDGTEVGASGFAAEPIRYLVNSGATNPTATSGTLLADNAVVPGIGDGTWTIKGLARDRVGNVSTVAVTDSFVIDTGPPTFVSATRTSSTITLNYSETLKTTVDAVPAASAFTVKVGSITVDSADITVTVSGSTVVLTIAAPALSGTVTVAYTVPAGVLDPRIKDSAGNAAAGQLETPATPPATGGSGPPPGPAPVVSDGPPANEPGGTDTTFTFSGSGSFECSVDGGPFVPCASPYKVSSLGEGSHTFRVRMIGGSETSRTWSVDATPPSASMIDGPAALTQDSGPTFTWAKDETTATSWCSLDGAAASNCVSPTSVSGLSYGDHTFEVFVKDAAGNSTRIAWVFKVIPPPVGASSTPVQGDASVAGEGGHVVAGNVSITWTAQAANEGLLMLLTDLDESAVQAPGGVQFAELVDATAVRLTDGTNIHEFSTWLKLTFKSVGGAVAVLTSADGGKTWQGIPRYGSESEIPADATHYALPRSDDSVEVGTRHLSLFALVRDAEVPTAPALTGSVTAEGLKLAWQPATDNSGAIARYVLLIDGAPAQSFSGSTLQATVAGFGPDDARSFQLAAEDAAGNRSALSPALRSVPTLTGLTLEQAQAALAGRGLLLGAVTEQESAQPAGTIIAQTPTTPAAAASGASVDVIVARGGAGSAKFVVRVAAAKTVPLKQRRVINVRVQVTRRANVAAVLRSPSNQLLYTWRTRVPAGVTILKLRIPPTIKRTGVYRLAIWAAAVGDRQRVVKRLRIKIVGDDASELGPTVNPPKKPIEVVLAGGGDKRRRLLGVGSNTYLRFSHVAKVEDAFELAMSARNVRVVVLDVDRVGVAAIREFRLVLPDVPVIALTRSADAASRARAAGARAALPPTATDELLETTIARLLGLS